MSFPPVIRAEGVSKRYVISHLARQQTIRDAIHHGLRLLWRRLRWQTQLSREEFWALRDVGFEVRQGEVLGVMGRNGAGKSTLLKVLSRITEPTRGRITIQGRVASLLEVGTGFHPELTGRENIFLNGAILGMSRAEVRARFDEIVAFAEIEQFIDTPVKRYSSGMYVRLAFAVAAHLEPQILIIDEVLAVGDAQFQRKCLGKMQAIASGQGRTVIFVSHNLAAMKQLTQRCLHLASGRLVAEGQSAEILDAFARLGRGENSQAGGRCSKILSVRLVDALGLELPGVANDQRLAIEVQVRKEHQEGLSLEAFLTDMDGTKLGLVAPAHFSRWSLPQAAGVYRVRLPINLPPLATGKYGFDVSTIVTGVGPDHYWTEALVFDAACRLPFEAHWELRKEYNAGFLPLDSAAPVCLETSS